MDSVDIITSPQGFLHGVLLKSESHEEFKKLYGSLLDDHKPVGVIERHLVIHIAVDLWRLRRIRSCESKDGVRYADNDLTNPDGLGRHRRRILKQIDRTIKLLKELQKDRPTPPGKAQVLPFPHANVKVEREPAGVRVRFRSAGPQDSSA